ncbi:hypothetical protein PF010_g6256 [Phytophthora fragariae]|uniref:BZIP domain-containing protein n=1 Tax=Phytophthora fragariae TaxID=53985 RepID=A0A6A3SR60_9STRA|nr:hypothetical protein PF003_g21623 [Phytophthora fragariae]KAE9122428.1 hypothetical protein PF007_g7460 [Phytophthora fragariae]KAE9123810.1 hypothetical protein PF010_g6256 [Phytophthora fragariae]KAE9243836.1 hypothetical protein PF002_g8079 [Phytophthora fragariae]KAE9318381.1 hypothetical protein PF001_g6405 [Phytophthora fragariae]
MATPPPTTSSDHDKMNPTNKGPATFKDSADANRARRSAIEKKSRQRRRNIVKRMQEEVKQLETVYADMTAKKGAGELSNLLGITSIDELQHKYSELTLVAHALEEDQATLQNLLLERECFYRTVRSLSEERRAENAFAVWDSGVPPSSSFKAKFRPLSMTEGYHTLELPASFMGWTDKRKYNPSSQVFQYAFTKQFPFQNAESLLAKSWNIFLDGPMFEKFSFDSSAQTRFEVLQVLNGLKDHRTPAYPMTFSTVQVIFRLQTPTGCALCGRTISSPEIKNALEPHEFLFDVFHWAHYNRLYDEYDNPSGCEIVAAGSITDMNRLKSNNWLFEIVCSVLRWESAIIAPLFLLQT